MIWGMDPQDLLRLTDARRHAADGSGRAIRLAAGVSMREVAEAIGATESRLSRWETGKVRPKGEVGARWAALLADLARHTRRVTA